MSTPAGGTWRGRAVRPDGLRGPTTFALGTALVVLCLVPIGPRWLHAAVVLAGLLTALALAARPRPAPRALWSLDADGVTTWSPDGAVAHLPADRYDAVAFGRVRDTARADPDGRIGSPGPDRLSLVATSGDAPRVVHEVDLERVGTPFAVCLVARDLGLRRLLPPAGRETLERDERRLRDLLATPVGRPAEAAPVTLTDPANASLASTIAVRSWFGGLGLALAAALAAPVGASWSGRVGAVIGVVLALVALPRLARGRAMRSSLRWTIRTERLDVVDTDLGTWHLARGAVGAVVVTSTADDPGHGRGPRSAVLVVDPDGRPVTEIPLRSLPPSAVAGPLGRCGYRVLVADLAPWDVRGGLENED